ncbi:hypothetical protein CEXT_22511 [Caerostris extrusa]|uniref:Uncharacterized protein n=1 Tax=Caerostris extrusa TaxID=172846 RepID=A0AAV4P5J6_CAEEX|nr:hypothetical protein CEXT_22511 [Caerostris extrusa]
MKSGRSIYFGNNWFRQRYLYHCALFIHTNIRANLTEAAWFYSADNIKFFEHSIVLLNFRRLCQVTFSCVTSKMLFKILLKVGNLLSEFMVKALISTACPKEGE